MRLMKKLTAFMTAAVLCLGSVMPAYADFYRQPSNIKGVLINSESEVADVVEVGASQVVCNFPMSWAFQPNMMNAYGSFLRAMDNAGITVTQFSYISSPCFRAEKEATGSYQLPLKGEGE